MVRGSLSRGWAVSLTLVPSFLPPPLCAVDDASGQWRGRPTDRPGDAAAHPTQGHMRENRASEPLFSFLIEGRIRSIRVPRNAAGRRIVPAP